MTVSYEEAKAAAERLEALADKTAEDGTIGEFDGQDINDVRTLVQRWQNLEAATPDFLLSAPITLGWPTVKDWAAKKQADQDARDQFYEEGGR